jgi:hypothetical protein
MKRVVLQGKKIDGTIVSPDINGILDLDSGASGTGYVKTVDSILPDANGNVDTSYAEDIIALGTRVGVNETNIQNNSSAITQNSALITGLNTSKQDKLTAGTNITISSDNVISATGGESYGSRNITSCGTGASTSGGTVDG